jgi:DNA-binding FadR family transcriptional regulator
MRATTTARTGMGHRRRRKLGEVVAERILAEIIRQGWPEGDVLGTEADFMDRYHVSRATFREAVRQLEWHGAAGMRRGPSGGLEVKAPPRAALVTAIKTYFDLSDATPQSLAEVTRILARTSPAARDGTGNAAIDLFLEAADGTTANQADKSGLREMRTAKLSETVALQIVRDIQSAQAGPKTSLGNEIHLQQKYGVSRAVVREALRPLELHGIVRVKTGSQGGILVDHIDPHYTVELATTYLHYARMRHSQLWEAHSRLEIAAVGQFAKKAHPARIAELQQAYGRLSAASARHYLVSANEFHQIIVDHCGNPATALFARILLRFSSEVLPLPDERYLPGLKDAHAALIDAVALRDVATSQQIMHDMFDHSRRWIARLESNHR